MIEVITPGIYSSIQDQGRFGFRNLGVPLSGVMDSNSANLANALLNNHQKCAVLETTFVGSILKFHQETFIAITGANCSIKINNKSIALNTTHKIYQNDILNIGKSTLGVRNYLAVSGGFKSDLVLNSRSFFTGISERQTIQKGEYIKISKTTAPIINRTKIKPRSFDSKPQSIKVKKGPEYDLLDKKSKETLLQKQFNISTLSNRMAYQLEPYSLPKNSLKADEIITSSVQPGTVQLTPSGNPIILMRDCQTTGGYARVLQLTESAINRLAQKRPNESIYFTLK